MWRIGKPISLSLESRVKELEDRLYALESKGITSIEKLSIGPEDSVVVKVYVGKIPPSKAMELVNSLKKSLKIKAKEVFWIPVSYEEAKMGCQTGITKKEESV